METLLVLFMTAVILLALFFIGLGSIKVYQYLYIGYHLRVSDTNESYVNLKFKGHPDELDAYITDEGKRMTLRVTYRQYTADTPTYVIPKSYDTPYDYILSGELDNDIREARLVTDALAVTDGHYNKHVLDNSEHLQNLPIKFYDVSDEIKRKLGIKDRM